MNSKLTATGLGLFFVLGCGSSAICEPASPNTEQQREVGVLRPEDFRRKSTVHATARMQSAEQLMRVGRYSEALDILLWCLVHGPQEDPAFIGVWGGKLPALFGELAHLYPPAQKELLHQRDELERRIRNLTVREYPVYSIYAGINRALDKNERTLDLFVALAEPGEDPRTSPLREFFPVVLESLLEADRFDIVAHWADLTLDDLAQARSIPDDGTDAMHGARLSFEKSAMRSAGLAYRALLQESSELAGRRFAAQAIAISGSVSVANTLVAVAVERCHVVEAERLRELARILLPDSEWQLLMTISAPGC
ncbi:MAG: hypothetical protein U0271_22645 [Polyangiaceae bacterium]